MTVLAWLYGIVIRCRNWLYDRQILSSQRGALPSIVIGNITVGGNGKSPISEEVCRMLVRRGKRPALLLRGYGGKIRGPHLVLETDTPADVGDEACMHRKLLGGIPVIVCGNRLQGILFAKNRSLADIVVLDDGLQHRALRAEVNCALFDREALADVERGALLPKGRLREFPEAALRRVDAVFLVQRGEVVPPPHWLSSPSFSVDLRLSFARRFGTGEAQSLSDLKSRKCIVVSSIAKPAQFEQMVSALGMEIVDVIRGRDHEPWTLEVFDRIARSDAELFVTTEKDAVKLERLGSPKKEGIVLSLGVELPRAFEEFLEKRGVL